MQKKEFAAASAVTTALPAGGTLYGLLLTSSPAVSVAAGVATSICAFRDLLRPAVKNFRTYRAEFNKISQRAKQIYSHK